MTSGVPGGVVCVAEYIFAERYQAVVDVEGMLGLGGRSAVFEDGFAEVFLLGLLETAARCFLGFFFWEEKRYRLCSEGCGVHGGCIFLCSNPMGSAAQWEDS